MRDLLAHGASPLISCPLHAAVAKTRLELLTDTRLELIALLLDHGADIDAVVQEELLRGAPRGANPYYRTALHEAAKTGNLECVRLLLDKGADPTVKDSSSDAPWQKVEDGEGECCRLLRKAAREWESGGSEKDDDME